MNSPLYLPGLALAALGLLVFLVPEKLWSALPLPHAMRTVQPSSAALFFFAGLTIIGLGVAVAGTQEAIRGRASNSWTATTATILSSSLEESQEARGRKVWRPAIRYQYTANGRVFEGQRLSFGLNTFPQSGGGAEAVIARYAPGTMHTVYVDPADDTNSVMTPGLDILMVFFAGIGVVLVVLGVMQLRMLKRAWDPPDVEYAEPA